ncbi:MAG TPA: efflux transporter periplasmic adaptor subunit [Opitutae bacterium]|nr:efflux transporter periplasmic adaptor subunit [Puniceicoccaceae bacterium]HBR94866.1 efflux transporter periplasmic adaptor subunit [Opitutae bacterium]|tara:strand:- start:6994 stop:8124 length:1131 start_codon:yes stop_codon:yes gene_type:complete
MKVLLPILILLSAGGITAALVILQPEAAEVTPERPVTNVEVITVQPQSVQLTVKSQGTLLPTTETDLIAEVSGRIIEMAELFNVGNRFRKGELLIKIDPADYEAAVANAAADLANAQLALAQEEAQAQQAAADWKALGEGAASDLTLRKPQLAQAQARIASAEANLKRAQRDLERTRITAPYDGIVLMKQADLGQYITANPGNPLGRIYSTQSAEVRLPITEQEASLLDQRSKRQRFVTLTQNKNGNELQWKAPLIRIEDNVDPTSRLLYAVARVNAPFDPKPEQPALRRGTFLHAEIEGRGLSDAYKIPRYALRGSNTVYILTETNTLITRTVQIIQSDAEEVVITAGLAPGERVATSPIAYYVEGMPVEVIADE